VAAKPQHSKKDLRALRAVLFGKLGSLSDSSGVNQDYAVTAAEVMAEIAGKANLSHNMPWLLEKLSDKVSFTSWSSSNSELWTPLLALLLSLRNTGSPENLGVVEHFMHSSPSSLQSTFEKLFFETPLTWARIAVRNGLYAGYMRPQRGANGEPKLSKLQEMLVSSHPMDVAAAFYATVLQQLEGPGAASTKPAGDLPDLSVAPTSSSPVGPNEGDFID
ncbi:MAG TPA: hypothetical protein VNI01_16485, partial [Elusimicrobiota bacterium]|nr:hypothetical protein [Elusimicrobiota bacterium]